MSDPQAPKLDLDRLHFGELREMAWSLMGDLGERKRRTPAERMDMARRTIALLSQFYQRTGGSEHDPREPEFRAGRGALADSFVQLYELDSRNYRWLLMERALSFVKQDLGPDFANLVQCSVNHMQAGTHDSLKPWLAELQRQWEAAKRAKRLAQGK